MYQDTVTIFNRKPGTALTGDTWYPTVLSGVNLNADRAAILAKYGAESKDTMMLNIRYQMINGETCVLCADGSYKPWQPPKAWDGTVSSITFNPGGDFIWAGEWTDGVVADSQYSGGFFGHMNREHDYVYSVSGVSRYSVIPHFEIMGR